MAVMRSTIDKIVPSPYYSITNKSTGEDYLIFTDDAILDVNFNAFCYISNSYVYYSYSSLL